MAMVGAAAALLMLCLPFEPAAARSGELFPWGDLFGIHRPKHRRVKQHTKFVPLPRPRPADAPAPPRGTAENGLEKGAPEKSSSAPAAQPEPAKPSPQEAEKSNKLAPPPGAEAPKEPTEQAAPAPAPQPSACRLALTDEIAIAPSIPDIHGPGDCGGEDLVRLEAVVLPDKRRVTLKPAAILRCKMASEIVDWVRSDIAPLATGLGGEVRTLDDYDSYDCRGRNGVSGAKLSEHGHANAIDVHGFDLAGGRSIVLTDPAVPRELREHVLHSACARFTTVLGPGSDGYHEQHIHLDLIERHNNYRICQWNVYDPMPQIAPLLPAARPSDAPPRPVDAKTDVKPEAATSDNGRPRNAKPDPDSSGRPAQNQAKRDPTKPDHTRSDRVKIKPNKSTGASIAVRKPAVDKPPTKKRRASRRFNLER